MIMKRILAGMVILLMALISSAVVQDNPIFEKKFTPGNPAEASGVVCKVVDGDTVDVEGVGRVRLADIDCPEMDTPNGPGAKEFATDHLLNRTAYLDIDDLRKTDSYGRLVAVLYLRQPDGSFENFNKKLVEAGWACIWDHKENEFSPADWWGGRIPDTVCIKGGVQPEAALSPGAHQGLLVGSTAPGKFPKYHLPSCRIAQRIGESRLVTFSSPEEARARGYLPCTECHPP
jgi:micrococcal nuclease